jgi:predicted aldo/keto reductase-like oxidoreductase
MIHFAIDKGVNYIDLIYPHSMKQYEQLAELVGRAIPDDYRKEVKIAVHLPLSLVGSAEELNSYLKKTLECLHGKRANFLVFDNINRNTWLNVQEHALLRRVEAHVESGEIDGIGFYFHDDYQVLRNILNLYENWVFCQFQYSFMDVEHHPGLSGIRFTSEKGLGVIASNPFLGGRLIQNIPEQVRVVWNNAPLKRPIQEWALRWVWNHPEISTVIASVSNLSQLVENIQLAELAETNIMSVGELTLINRVREAYNKLKPVPCRVCRCCMPCPVNIDMPRIIELYNEAIMYNNIKLPQFYYSAEKHNIESCNKCGKCRDACPKKIDIPQWIEKANRLFSSKN